jgi:hypothetical protein
VALAVQTTTDLTNPLAWATDAVLVSATPNGDGTETLTYRTPTPNTTEQKRFMRVKATQQ